MAKQGGKTVIEQENEAWIEMAIKRKRSLAHKRETKGVKHETWTRLQAEKASGAYGTREEDEPDL
jgi:hypothetical protein